MPFASSRLFLAHDCDIFSLDIILKILMDGLCHIDLHLRSEDELLLACASTTLGEGQYKTLRRLAGECKDWDYVLHAARCHGLAPLVSTNLDRAAGDIVPREPLDLLRRRLRANGARNLILTQELLSLVGKFGAAGIEVIPLKGPILAMTAYGNVALREFLDLDVLVPKQHFDRAGRLLVQCGYQPPSNQTGKLGSTRIEDQVGCDFVRKDGRVSVEMHWSFIQKWLGFEVDLDALWKTPEYVNIGGTHVRKLPTEIALLYLCAHGAKHQWSRLCWIVDVTQLLHTQPTIDWDGLLKTAKRNGCRRTLFLGLRLAHTLLGADIPQEVLTQMRHDDSADALAQGICRELFLFKTRVANHRGGWAKDWFYLRTKERWLHRFRYLRYLSRWLLLPSQRDKEWLPLPGYLGWLYIFLRPIRAACDVVRPRSRNGPCPPE